MTDREKVIKALACCVFPVSKGFPYQSHIADEGCEAVECPYRGDCDQMLLDALELLKEQEAVKPIVDHYALPLTYTTVQFIEKYYCGICNEKITRNNVYCHKCGRKVKWDERTH